MADCGKQSAKHHLYRITKGAHLKYEEQTLLLQIEAISNSRSLTPLSTDLDNLKSLTSGHFLIGCLLTA